MKTPNSEPNLEPKFGGLTILTSQFNPKETMDRLEGEVTARGMRVFARIDHAALAMEAGLALNPTELLIFGNPTTGTPLMQASQSIGIDLPLKLLAWQDAEAKSWIAYNNPQWLASRHGITASNQIATVMAATFADLSKTAGGIP